MKYLFVVVAVSMYIGCNRNDEFGEGITREVTNETYEGIANVQREVYRRELLPIKTLGFSENGNILYQTYYIPLILHDGHNPHLLSFRHFAIYEPLAGKNRYIYLHLN